MLTSAALVTFQETVLLPPTVMGFGVAVKETIVGNGITVTVAVAVIELPPASVAVNV